MSAVRVSWSGATVRANAKVTRHFDSGPLGFSPFEALVEVNPSSGPSTQYSATLPGQGARLRSYMGASHKAPFRPAQCDRDADGAIRGHRPPRVVNNVGLIAGSTASSTLFGLEICCFGLC